MDKSGWKVLESAKLVAPSTGLRSTADQELGNLRPQAKPKKAASLSKRCLLILSLSSIFSSHLPPLGRYKRAGTPPSPHSLVFCKSWRAEPCHLLHQISQVFSSSISLLHLRVVRDVNLRFYAKDGAVRRSYCKFSTSCYDYLSLISIL